MERKYRLNSTDLRCLIYEFVKGCYGKECLEEIKSQIKEKDDTIVTAIKDLYEKASKDSLRYQPYEKQRKFVLKNGIKIDFNNKNNSLKII